MTEQLSSEPDLPVSLFIEDPSEFLKYSFHPPISIFGHWCKEPIAATDDLRLIDELGDEFRYSAIVDNVRRTIWGFYFQADAADIIREIKRRCEAGEWHERAIQVIEKACKECGQVVPLAQVENGLACDACRRERSRELAKANGNIRRFRELCAAGSHTEEEWQAVLKQYGHCLRCGATENLTRDHVVPLSRGGSNSIDNLQPLCGRCNSWKHTRTIDFRDNPRKEAIGLLVGVSAGDPA